MKYLNAEELKNILLDNTRRITIVDVRDSDFIGGNIKGAINIPSTEFKATLDDQLERFMKTKSILVFHCMLSQVRGPSCATKLERLAVERGLNMEIYVLEGGFAAWEGKFGKINELTENYDPELWDSQRDYL